MFGLFTRAFRETAAGAAFQRPDAMRSWVAEFGSEFGRGRGCYWLDVNGDEFISSFPSPRFAIVQMHGAE